MPVAATMSLPKTNDEHEFEEMVADVLSVKYNVDFRPFGRRGQKQYGIDVLSNTNADIVAQCKNYKLTTTDIVQIVDKFTLDQKIRNFIIATSMNRDTQLQIYVQSINTQSKYSFDVSIMFWEDIVPYMIQYPSLYEKYYASFGSNFIDTIDINDIKNHFNKGIQKYHILDFLMRDVFVEGIPTSLPTQVEGFTCEMKDLLQNNLLLQNELIYKAVFEFCDELDSLNYYLGLSLLPDRNSLFYRYIPNYNNIDEENHKRKIQNNITEKIRKLDMIFGKINQGMTLFP